MPPYLSFFFVVAVVVSFRGSSSDGVVVVPPLGLFGILFRQEEEEDDNDNYSQISYACISAGSHFIAGLDVDRVIRWSFLLLATVVRVVRVSMVE